MSSLRLTLVVLLKLASSTAIPDQSGPQLARILQRAPHLVNSETELNELFDWLNQRCDGCFHKLGDAKSVLAKEISTLQTAQEKEWAAEFDNEQKLLADKEEEAAFAIEERSRQRAEHMLQRKEELLRQEEEAAKAQWQKEQEIVWQKEEQQVMEAHDAAEKKAHQESENRMAKVRKEKANLKKTLYTKHNRVQWQEFEELKEAESAKKEQQAAKQAEITFAALRQQKKVERQLRLVVAEQSAAAEARRQKFIARFWPTFRPIVSEFLVQFAQGDMMMDSAMASPLMGTEMAVHAVGTTAAASR
jgi:hypothetical protein